jgi:hypothetical protein
VQIRTGDYLDLVKDAHEQRGGIAGQRDVLKTTTAKRIRDRMISDIQAGAVLPPVVIGVVVDDKTAQALESGPHDQATLLQYIHDQELSIIDGMQRTASLLEAGTADSAVFDRDMRVEFWIAKSVRALIYRMLVLNTGQVPWTLARQLSVVYEPLLHEIKQNVKNLDKVFTPDKPGRRVGSGQFSSDSLVELYLAFSLRKTNVDPRESLSEEFSRLDFVQNLSDAAFQEHFYKILSLLVDLDLAFERYEGQRPGQVPSSTLPLWLTRLCTLHCMNVMHCHFRFRESSVMYERCNGNRSTVPTASKGNSESNCRMAARAGRNQDRRIPRYGARSHQSPRVHRFREVRAGARGGAWQGQRTGDTRIIHIDGDRAGSSNALTVDGRGEARRGSAL